MMHLRGFIWWALAASVLIIEARAQVCGDGTIDGIEQCDDNNTIVGDGCSENCTIEDGYICNVTVTPTECVPDCGDGRIIYPEQCDDNNTIVGDGCSENCTIEDGYICNVTVIPTECTPECGDGRIIYPEQCDDANENNLDGCSSNCMVEPGYVCQTMTNATTGYEFSVCSRLCGNGQVDSGEECDDGNSVNADGCSGCVVDDNFQCDNSTGVSICSLVILLDLNAPDNTTLDYTTEFFDIDVPVFLADLENNMTTFLVTSDGGNWQNITAVILEDGALVTEEVAIFGTQALAEGRWDQDYGSMFLTFPLNLAGYPDVNGRQVISGAVIQRNALFLGDSDFTLSATEIERALQAIGYIAYVHPGYTPRDVCIIAADMLYSTTACVTLFFIGRNDDRPEITYTPSDTVTFVEQQPYPVIIINGSINVTDQDHPTRYPMTEAEARIVDFVSGAAEELSVSYELPGFTYVFDTTEGVLTVTGNATTDVYSDILANITYFNNMAEPAGNTRTIQLRVFDGIFYSNMIDVMVLIQNVNDNPAVSLQGDAPVVTSLRATYREGDPPQAIVPDLFVIDTDPMAMIQRAVVELQNPIDGESGDLEEIAFSGDIMDLSVDNTSHRVELTGLATPDVYTTILRTLTYQNREARPGNPSTVERMIRFYVEDEFNTTSLPSTVMLSIEPVNDAPILLYVPEELRTSQDLILTGTTTISANYTEDDPLLNFGQDIYLRDVDGMIGSASVYLTGLLNRENDDVTFDTVLAQSYNISWYYNNSLDGLTREIGFLGEATAEQYEEVLQTLSYQNLLTDNTVEDGQRNITITATDAQGTPSNRISAYIEVSKRNDGPAINLGDGVDIDFTTTFVENGESIRIAIAHLLTIMDEEGSMISSINFTLVATNGDLDGEEYLFLRTPMLLDPDTTTLDVSQTSIYIAINETAEFYRSILDSVRYSNQELEPTIFNASGANLTREVIIRITDASGDRSENEVRVGIIIEPINDNPPRILIDSDPTTCSEDCRSLGVPKTRNRRELRFPSKQRRKRMAYTFGNSDNSMAPQVVTAQANFTKPNCLTSVTLTFSANTTAPAVEIQQDLDLLLYFDPPELNWGRHHGYWVDYQTMVVVWRECVRWEGVTSSGKQRPMFVVFEAHRGGCNYSTPCTTGVCFFNSTGCPLTGYHAINTTPTSGDTRDTVIVTDRFYLYFNAGVITVALSAVAVVIMLMVRRFRPEDDTRPREKHMPALWTQDKNSSPKTQKPVTTLTPQSVTIDFSPPKGDHNPKPPGKIEVAPPEKPTKGPPVGKSPNSKASPTILNRHSMQTTCKHRETVPESEMMPPNLVDRGAAMKCPDDGQLSQAREQKAHQHSAQDTEWVEPQSRDMVASSNQLSSRGHLQSSSFRGQDSDSTTSLKHTQH